MPAHRPLHTLSLLIVLALLSACQSTATRREPPSQPPQPTLLPPNAPLLALAARTHHTVSLSWTPDDTAPSDPNAELAPTNAYTLRHSPTGAAWRLLDIDLDTSTAYTHTELSPLSLHHYQVRAESTAGPSAWSNTLVTQTLAANAPSAPELTTQLTDSNLIELTWTIELETDDLPLQGFDIETSLDAAAFRPLAQPGARARAWTHRIALPDTTHYYRIRARNAAHSGPWSRTAEATTTTHDPQIAPPVPQDLVAEALSPTAIELTWPLPVPEPNQPAPDSYDVQWTTTTLPDDWRDASTVQSPVFLHRSLPPDTRHYYRVRSRASSLTSAWSIPAAATTPAITETASLSSPHPVAHLTAPTSVAEPAIPGDTTTARFTVRLSQPSATTVRIDYRTEPATHRPATPHVDYEPVSGTLALAPGATEAHVDVNILHDAHDDAGDTFAFILSNPRRADLHPVPTRALLTITNDGTLPRAWLAHTARAHAGAAADAIAARARLWNNSPPPATWLRLSHTRHAARRTDVALRGDTDTFQLGADTGNAHVRAGLALSLSRSAGNAGHPLGEPLPVDDQYASFHPYLLWRPSSDHRFWMTAGHGTGRLEHTPEGESVLSTALSVSTIALGTHHALRPDHAPVRLHLDTDALYATARSAQHSRLAPSRAHVAHLRIALRGAHTLTTAHGALIEPTAAFGVRVDAGDADKGLGALALAGLSLRSPDRHLSTDIRATTTLWHRTQRTDHWSLSASTTYRARPDTRGLELTIAPSYGVTSFNPLDHRPTSTPPHQPLLHARIAYPFFANALRRTLTPFTELDLLADAPLRIHAGATARLTPHLDASLHTHWRHRTSPTLSLRSRLRF